MNELPPILTGQQAWKLTKGGVGQNLFYRMLARGEIPGAFNVSEGDKAAWRVKTRPFLAWLNGEAQEATSHAAA